MQTKLNYIEVYYYSASLEYIIKVRIEYMFLSYSPD
jgi:hypothetical protein